MTFVTSTTASMSLVEEAYINSIEAEQGDKKEHENQQVGYPHIHTHLYTSMT